YSMKTLPQPKNKQIEIIPISRKRYAVIYFSGFPTEYALRKHQKNLIDFLTKERINTRGKPILAFYNPPWTLPFLRRNEIMFEIE
ncbi:MAG: heme-binding protein, partial [Candidatus Paracaedibacteraceae bacterium]|nr:heme-binding protein [Candidatus Paracaedibacteraceae bacterium]